MSRRAEHGASFSIHRRPRSRKTWCKGRYPSGKRCNTVVSKEGQRCPHHDRLMAAYQTEAKRLQQSDEQAELRSFLRSYRYLNRYVGQVADRVLDGAERLTVRQAGALGRIAAEKSWELSSDFRLGKLPDHLRAAQS